VLKGHKSKVNKKTKSLPVESIFMVDAATLPSHGFETWARSKKLVE
jgi:hypothetical protein